MDKLELLERYEIFGEEADYLAARPLYEHAVSEAPEANLLVGYGYLLECHGRSELRRAVDQYRRAIELDPAADKPHYQLIHAMGALGDAHELIAMYRTRMAAAPNAVREHRFLASAYLATGEHEAALKVIAAGLDLAANDPGLLELRGNAKAQGGDPDSALADWQGALEFGQDEMGISPLYSTAYLLEREARLAEAEQAWQSILEWNERRGYTLAAAFPKRELERVRTLMADQPGAPNPPGRG